MRQSHRRKKVGLLGPYSFGNLGNAALQQTLLQQINKFFPGSEIYGCCIDPESNLGDGGVLPFPLSRRVRVAQAAGHPASAATETAQTSPRDKWKAWAKRIPLVRPGYRLLRAIWSRCKDFVEMGAFLLWDYRFARGSRILVVGLGGVIDDLWNGPWGDPFSLFKWAVIAKIAGTPFVFLSVGAEKIETRLGRFFLRKALSLASYRSFRDERSKRKAEAIGVSGPNLVFPDLAFGLETQNHTRADAARVSGRLVGVSPMAYCDPRVWPIKDSAAYETYLKTLCGLVVWLLRQDYRVALVATQFRMDRAPLRELKEMVLREIPGRMVDRISEPDVRTVDEFVIFASQLEMFVSSRLHGVILPFLVDTPVLAVSHSDKIDSLMEDMGLSEYCAGIDGVGLESLTQRVQAIAENRELLRTRIHGKVAEYRVSLDKQFEAVFRKSNMPAEAIEDGI